LGFSGLAMCAKLLATHANSLASGVEPLVFKKSFREGNSPGQKKGEQKAPQVCRLKATFIQLSEHTPSTEQDCLCFRSDTSPENPPPQRL